MAISSKGAPSIQSNKSIDESKDRTPVDHPVEEDQKVKQPTVQNADIDQPRQLDQADVAVRETTATSSLQSDPSLFDQKWYLDNNPDVARAKLDPVKHYLDHGAAEGRDPNANFSTKAYMLVNRDVVASGLNPFLHFLLYGRYEGRDPKPLVLTPIPGRASTPVQIGNVALSAVEGKTGSKQKGVHDSLSQISNRVI